MFSSILFRNLINLLFFFQYVFTINEKKKNSLHSKSLFNLIEFIMKILFLKKFKF